ncbi:MAG: UDP-N-acetylmuramoyl-L-alanine--D-glutamate ligase [Clostridia bacterium]|nr:UDP-N-acetylmuramoyl-L-alanine--D-glutamate ligase [Clostridia bacterium]
MTLEAFCKTPACFSVALLGFGRANRAVLAWLREHGGTATVYTEFPLPPEAENTCAGQGIVICAGAFPAVFSEQVLVRSPGIRPDIPAILQSVAVGALLTSEVELLMSLLPCRCIGITGSDGKTTTASLTAALLRAAGYRVWLGGNNGTPLLPAVSQMRERDIAVLELSSFQLMTVRRAPEVAVITNITPNHLNWHTDMAEYIAAKCCIFAADTRLVLNVENAQTRKIGEGKERAVIFFSSSAKEADFATDIVADSGAVYASGNDIVVIEKDARRTFSCLGSFSLPGKHNLENLLAAIGATAPFLGDGAPRAALREFRGVAHRLEYVDTVRGVTYYNSSIDTSPTRTAAALAALGTRPLVILGGRGKGISFEPLAVALAAHAKAAYLYGEAAGEIAAVLGTALPYKSFFGFTDAFLAAAGDAKEGDTVLLSPACTAFGEFRDFEERGEVFCRLVQELERK